MERIPLFGQKTNDVSKEPLDLVSEAKSSDLETFEKIIDKIVDIKESGTAFTFITPSTASSVALSTEERVASIFSRGILNVNWLKEDLSKVGRGSDVYPNAPVNQVNQNKQGIKGNVFFNIVGRTSEGSESGRSHVDLPDGNEISFMMQRLHEFGGGIAIIFDLAAYDPEYKEDFKLYEEGKKTGDFSVYKSKRKNVKNRTYSNQKFSEVLDDEGFPKAPWDYGHLLSNRIPPRFFKGIVINSQDSIADFTNNYLGIIEKSSSGLLPIYDEQGNLLWPKQMSHDEIVKIKEDKAARDTSV